MLYGVEVDVEWLNEYIYGCFEQFFEYDLDSLCGDLLDCEDVVFVGVDWDDGLGV